MAALTINGKTFADSGGITGRDDSAGSEGIISETIHDPIYVTNVY